MRCNILKRRYGYNVSVPGPLICPLFIYKTEINLDIYQLRRHTNSLVTLGLVLVVALTLVFVCINVSENIWSMQWLALLGIALGCYALSLLRPQRLGLSPPHVMLSLGFAGMLLGFGLDIFLTPIVMIAKICTNSHNLSLLQSLILHFKLMPFMHAGMLLGGVLAIPGLRYLRPQCRKLCSMLAQNMLCAGWMLLGMTVGAVVFIQLLQQSDISYFSLSLMLGGMFCGMVWGMVISVFLYRQYFALRDALDANRWSRSSHM